jgi:hypothetical protein
MTPILVIGGIKDGERIIEEGHYFHCCEAPKWKNGEVEEPERHTYRRISLGSVQVYVHQSFTHGQAMERLIKIDV